MRELELALRAKEMDTPNKVVSRGWHGAVCLLL